MPLNFIKYLTETTLILFSILKDPVLRSTIEAPSCQCPTVNTDFCARADHAYWVAQSCSIVDSKDGVCVEHALNLDFVLSFGLFLYVNICNTASLITM